MVRELVSLQEELDMNDKPENSPGQESMMRRDEEALNKSEDVILSENGNETTPTDLLEAHQNQIDGGSDNENSEILEANLIGEEASEKIEKEAAESSMNKGVESAPELTIKDEDGKSNEVLENDGTSIAKEDHEDLVLGQGSELSFLQDDSSTRATDFAPTDRDMLGSELAELPRGVFDDFCAQEGTNHVAVEAGTSKADQAKQLKEGLIELPLTSESHYDAADKENNEPVEIHEVLDLPLNGVNVKLETEETSPVSGSLDNCSPDDKLGTEEEVESKSGDARFEPDECTALQPQNFIADMLEPSEASDERELPTSEACIRKYTTCNKLPEKSGMTDSNNSSMLEEPLDAPTEKEMLLQESNLEQETSLINESANTYVGADVIGVEGAAEAKSGDDRIDSDNCITQQSVVADINDSGEVSEERQPQITEACQREVEGAVDIPPEMEVLSERGQECDTEHPLPKETLEKQGLEDASGHEENAVDPTLVQVSPARDELTESNRKQIEENERLRDMMEKLIKSGQEQLTAISSLSGKVKDLERRLSRRKKLKVKQYRAPRPGSSCMTKFDGSAEEKTINVAMLKS